MATPEYARSDGNATPDPWTVEPRFDAVLEGYTPPTMYEVVFLDHLVAEVTSESDANLIAAAPELRKIAEMVVDIDAASRAGNKLDSWTDWFDQWRQMVALAHAAIAKAKGE